jgi:glutamate/tyrosine decarboxylase-like PLP-dependent enzyme
MKRHNLNKKPVVLCPASSHYSFLRDVFMIGLGEENLMIIQIAANTSMNIGGKI